MIRTVVFSCHIPKTEADALNAESGRIYSQVVIEHWRRYRKQNVWMSRYCASRYNDGLNQDTPKLLHSNSIDAAQHAFDKACKTIKALRKAGNKDANYPRKRKYYRTTVWGSVTLRKKEGVLLLSLAKGLEPISVRLPRHLQTYPEESFIEMRLVWSKSARRYDWHLVVDDGSVAPINLSDKPAAVDLGEIHPATITDGQDACVVSCRELRSVTQHTAKRLAKFRQAQSGKVKGSRRWNKIQRSKNRFLARQKRRSRSLQHKVSRAVIDWAVEHETGKLFIGDVRDIADGGGKGKVHNQRMSRWPHGELRKYIGYKAEALGIEVDDRVPEQYTSQTCPQCKNRHKPKGRVYKCPVCGFCSHRDVVGASNILSVALTGELGTIVPFEDIKYRYPVLRGKRSSGEHPASCTRQRKP